LKKRAIAADADDFDDSPRRGSFWLRLLLRRPRDTLMAIVGTGAVCAILINALFLQRGPHPAPIFGNKPRMMSQDATGTIAVLPRPRPAVPDAAKPEAVRTRTDIVSDLQRELARRGFYDGVVDGSYGSKTDAAIRDFEQVFGQRVGNEPTETMLQTIVRSPNEIRATLRTINAPARPDAVATLIAPSRQQVVAVQRALSDFGYGQIKANGVYDADTRAAIERFERERKIPITGQISERLLRELGSMIGRPLD
jgi:peptidoglycan hydrolase-like protein with peptidoglycan-binding domain